MDIHKILEERRAQALEKSFVDKDGNIRTPCVWLSKEEAKMLWPDPLTKLSTQEKND